MLRTLLCAIVVSLLALCAGAQDTFVNDGGMWRDIQEVHVNDGGTWRLVFQAAVFFVRTDPVGDVSVGFSDAEIQYQSDGDIAEITTSGGSVVTHNWVTPTSLAPGAYTVRASLVSGSTPAGAALDTDLALTSSRTWGVSTSSGTVTSTLTITIKDGGGNVKASGNITLSAQAL